MLKSIVTKLSVLLSTMAVVLPAMAHDGSEQASVMSGLVHFLTEPDHLLVMFAVAGGLIYLIRKHSAKRF
ncbi:HupE/UreJ family protein [uncultured Neptuniibacter sp.]|uniref:HupE/UreJ family protein n=1 Tax=uncultured Neptuniibacter sp. TaxID=502143 RepID=UPI00262E52D0|nr:HupE/UreJ family protein [uncultured Neptuniibacter sp.]